MVFSSLPFLFMFLPIFLIVYYILPFRVKNGWLLIGSLLFYAYGALEEPYYILLMVGGVVLDYILARCMDSVRRKADGTTDADRQAKKIRAILIPGVCLHLGILFFFKYTGFWLHDLVLPLGISFYTFQMISYLMDVSRGKIAAERNLIDLGTYLCMFPQLIAGPIVTYDCVKDSMKAREISLAGVDDGLREFTIGLGLKVLLANQLGSLWNSVNSIGFESISTPLAWLGIIAFSMQIYFDFYGYSLMAIGLGRMLGFELPVNFRHPYMAVSMTDFWRRWHITLGSWFREYVYIPLGGNRAGRFKLFRNIAIVWILTGVWHGAGLNFLLWGLLLAVILMLERTGISKFLDRHHLIGHLYMLFLIPLSWIPFAVERTIDIDIYLTRLFPVVQRYSAAVYENDYIKYGEAHLVTLLAGLLFVTPLPRKIYERFKKSPLMALLLLAIFLGAVYCMYIGLDDPFLYFRF